MSLPTRKDHYFLGMLAQVASLATCPRRSVGAIFVDEHFRILSTGYNGVPRGLPHCTETPCEGRYEEHGKTAACLAVHAEQNAILQCLNLDAVHTVYCSASPCFGCTRMLLNLRGLRRVVFTELYPDAESLDLWSRRAADISVELHDGPRGLVQAMNPGFRGGAWRTLA